MEKKAASGITLTLLLISILTLASSTSLLGKSQDKTSVMEGESPIGAKLVPFLDTFITVMESNTTDWDKTYIASPFVIYDDGLYKMWYQAKSTLGRDAIACAESSDGVAWLNKQVVHNDSGAVPPEYYVTGSPWIIKEDGTYRMWHMDYYEVVAGEWSGYIAHMTSVDGISWPAFMSADDQKVLSAQGQEGVPQGDGFHIAHACVIHEPGGYVMWYTVHDHGVYPVGGYPSIWRATSIDGITWSNRQLALPYVTDTWEQNVGGASVVKEPDGTYTMFYNAWYANATGEAIGIAKSVDGVTWTERKQFLRASDLGANVTFMYGYPGLVHFKNVDGKRYLYFNYYNKGDEIWKFGRIQIGVWPSIQGDINNDGVVDILDLYILGKNYGKTDP